MDTQMLTRLAAALDEVLDLDGVQRDAYLHVLRRESPSLAALLAQALADEAVAIAVFDQPLSLVLPDVAPASVPRAPQPLIGAHIGAWRLTRELGRGGMGQVWLAERDDGQYRLQVAIKLIDATLDSEVLREQLRRERQILADLDHPQIAHLLDGGVRDQGTPWYAMEYVEGRALDRYCEEQQLPLLTRLRLLASICRVVHHAHTRLVIHRDLKPGNILVDDSGVAHLLDFGIAKLIDPDNARGATRLTLLAAATPAYAAPEQLRGETVGTAADIYALGVIAHELLAGCRPEPARGTDAGSDARGPLPSKAIADPRRRAEVRGDLDAIVSRALAPQPTDRYASALAMADDIGRHLDGLPVEARQAGAGYQARKFIRRHWLGVGLGAAAVLALCAALAVSIVQTRHAQAELVRANAVEHFLLGVFGAAQPLAGNSGVMTQRDLADKASADLDKMLADQPQTRIDMLIAVGRVYRKLGLAKRSRALLQRASDALDRHKVAASDPRRITLLLALGRADYDADDMHAAITSLKHADALARTYNGSAKLRANILYELGSSYSAAGNFSAALDTLAQAREQALAEGGDPARIPNILLERALALRRRGNLPAAIDAGEEAIKAGLQQYGPDDLRTAGMLSTVGAMHRRAGHLKRAETLLRQAVDIDKRAYGQPQAAPVNNLANILQDEGKYSESMPMFELGLKLADQRYGPDSVQAASYRRNLALAQMEAGLPTQAETNMRKAYQRVAAQSPPASRENLEMREQLVEMLITNGKADEAGKLLARVLTDSPGYQGVPGTTLRLAHMDAARLALARHDIASAQRDVDQARAGLPAHSLETPDLVRLQLLAGDVAKAGGHATAARKHWQAALTLARTKLGTEHPLVKAASQRLHTQLQPSGDGGH